MSDTPQTPEAVAFALAIRIQALETNQSEGKPKPTRKHLLDLYDECRIAVRGGRHVQP